MSDHSNEMRIELPETEAPPEYDPQADRRAEIAEAYEKRREAEIIAQREQMGLPAEEATEPPVEDAPEQAARDDAPLYPVVPPTPPAAPQLFPMPLPDGRVTYVTAEQAAYLAQVGAATLSRPVPPPSPPQVYQPAPTPRPSFDGERAKEIAQRLSFGTTDEQAQALQDYAQAIQPAVDVQALRREIKQELRSETLLEQNLAHIGQEFPEIFNDRVLTQVAALQLHELRGNPYNAQRPDLDLYREACTHVRSRFNTASASAQSAQTPTRGDSRSLSADRLERKRNAPSIPGGADHRMTMQEAAPREPTASQIIAQMRTARGQAA